MTGDQLTELVTALRAAAAPAEPEFMTVPELAAWLRLDAMGVKDPERWIKDRLMPRHPERLPHCSFTRNHPVFSREDRAWIRDRYHQDAREDSGIADGPGAQVLEFDPKAIKRGARALGLGTAGTTA